MENMNFGSGDFKAVKHKRGRNIQAYGWCITKTRPFFLFCLTPYSCMLAVLNGQLETSLTERTIAFSVLAIGLKVEWGWNKNLKEAKGTLPGGF